MFTKQFSSSDPEQGKWPIEQSSELRRTGGGEWESICYENMDSICFLVDVAGMIHAMNSLGVNRLGYTIEELKGQPIATLFASQDPQKDQQKWLAFVQEISGESLLEKTLWDSNILCKNGNLLWVKVTAKIVADGVSAAPTPLTLSSLYPPSPPLILVTAEEIPDPHIAALMENPTGVLQQIQQQLNEEINHREILEARLRKQQQEFQVLNEKLRQEMKERRHLEKVLQEREEQFRQFYQTSWEAVAITEQGSIVDVNHNFAALFGYKPLEIVGKNLLELAAPASRQLVKPTTVLENPSIYQSVFIKKDGTTFLAEVREQMIPYQGRNLQVKTLRNLTDDDMVSVEEFERETFRDAARVLSLLHTTLESTADGIVVVSTEGHIVSYNQKFVQMWRIPNEAMMSLDYTQPLVFLMRQLKEPEAFVRRVNELYTQKFPSTDILELKDGRFFERHTQPQIVRDTVIGRVWCFRDITEQKKAEFTLRQQAERERLIAQIQARIRASLDCDAILKTTVAEVRDFLKTDRVLIFRFEPDWSGVVEVESVGGNWIPIQGNTIYDPCFAQTYVSQYQEGRVRSIDNISIAHLSQCHLNLLSGFEVKANLVVPIIQTEPIMDHQALAWPKCDLESRKDAEISAPESQNRLWGLLIAHHCSEPRHWQSWEIELLKQLATQVAIAIQQSLLYHRLEDANRELQRLANLDGLTQVANRRRFNEVLNQECQRLNGGPLSLILCDIDCFKAYNDTYGHQAGDACLQQVAAAIQDTMQRASDLVARYGGEELAVILPDMDVAGALQVAQEIHQTIRALKIPHTQSPVSAYVTLSLGVASGTYPHLSPQMLIAAADRALYQAKSQGRDRVILASDS